MPLDAYELLMGFNLDLIRFKDIFILENIIIKSINQFDEILLIKFLKKSLKSNVKFLKIEKYFIDGLT